MQQYIWTINPATHLDTPLTEAPVTENQGNTRTLKVAHVRSDLCVPPAHFVASTDLLFRASCRCLLYEEVLEDLVMLE